MTSIANQLLFGTAGVPQSTSGSSTLSGIQQVSRLGLDCLEIELVRGVKTGSDMARRIKDEAQKLNVNLSVHAPYYINLNSSEEGTRLSSQERLLSSTRLAELCKAKSLVFHPGYYGKGSPEDAFENIKKEITEVISTLKSERISVVIRPETMGKKSQFGSLEETLFLCREVDEIMPCIDFSHIQAREGKVSNYLDFYRILKKIEKKLGRTALENLHIHISGAEYNERGEVKHLDLKDSDFRYDEWVQALKDFDVKGMVICESPNQDTDAIMLKKLYHEK